jgi:hypothetical protein
VAGGNATLGLKKMPDGQPPAVEEGCSGLSGPAFGLCNAYCEAMDCDCDGVSCTANASQTACDRVAQQSAAATGGDLPPCSVDTIPPELAIVEPPAPVTDDSTPLILVTDSDAGASVEVATLVITVDTVDRTALCTIGPSPAGCASPELGCATRKASAARPWAADSRDR